ncbi:hypothetical protein IZY60_10990 [Lutibacter sp. B2]|nr:hypothetical protein [Lutibacter sp. B2]
MKKILLILFLIIIPFSSVYSQEYKQQYFYDNEFSCKVPETFKIDETSEDIVTKLYTPDGSKIYIYNQPLKNASVRDYIDYSNEQIMNKKGSFEPLEKDSIRYDNNAKAYRFLYTRPKIDNIENDKNMYYEINEYYPLSKRVITFWLKTDQDHIDEYKAVLNEMARSAWIMDRHEDKVSINPENWKEHKSEINLEGEDISINIPNDKMLWGIFHPHSLLEGNYLKTLQPTEEKMDKKFEFIMTYADFDDYIPTVGSKNVYKDGRLMMFTLQPWVYLDRDNIIIVDIIKGKYDDYIRKWAQDIRELKNPVLFRFANEMNGDWCPWSTWYFGKDPDLYIEAWKRVHTIFKEEKADNAQFVWNPHDRSYPDFKWNSPHLYYPGDEYVDWVGLTGYNNGTSFKEDVWRDFKDIYYPLYADYMKYYKDKPFLVTEFSCNETGGDKAKWIEEGFEFFKDMPNIKMAVWFDQVDQLWQYNIDSSEASFEAFKKAMNNPYFIKDAVKRKDM